MKIFLYSKVGDQSADTLEELIKTHLPEVETAVYKTIDELSQSLRHPIEDLCVAIPFISNQEDLKNIFSIRYLFQSTRIILLLPDKTAETVALAFLLQQRGIGIL